MLGRLGVKRPLVLTSRSAVKKKPGTNLKSLVTQLSIKQFVFFLECSDLLFKRSDALFEADDLRIFS